MQNGRFGKINMLDLNFFKDKKVFITGHTGFKGTWLCKILIDAGANLKGYSLKPVDECLFNKIIILLF